MRPKTIVYFERIIFGTLLLDVLRSYLTWDQILQAAMQAATLDYDSSTATILTIIIFSFVLVGSLALLVSRRRSKIAMWVSIAWFIAWFALYLALFVSDIIVGVQFKTDDIITLAVLVGQGVAYGLLFTPSARRWMNRVDEKAKA